MRVTEDEYKAMLHKHAAPAPAKRSKYGAVKTTVDGIVFDSKREADRYQELRLLEKAGHIYELFLQPRFPLNVATTDDDVATIGYYVADFAYRDRREGGTYVVEDAKGFRTPMFKWKIRHLQAQTGILVREV